MAYTSSEYLLAAVSGVAQTGTAVISKTFTSHDPRFVVVTVKHSGTTGSLALFDSADGFTTEASCQTMTLDASGVTILRYNATTNGLLRNQMRAKLTGATAVTVTSVNVCFES